MRAVMLTTVDNPFDPFDNFDEWYKIDMQFGYNTCALAARLAPTAESLPDAYNESIKEECYSRWCKMFPLTYKMIVREVEEPDYEEIIEAEEDYSDESIKEEPNSDEKT